MRMEGKEPTGQSKISIIKRIEESRAQKDLQFASVETAKRQLTGFIEKINTLIIARVPRSEINEITAEENFRKRIFSSEDEDHETYDTALKATLPSSKGKIEIEIMSSSHPQNNSYGGENRKYLVNITDMDHVVEINKNGAKLVSKKRSYSMSRYLMQSHSRPVWEKEMDKDELDEYTELFDYMNDPSNDIEFDGSTAVEMVVAPPKKSKGKVFSIGRGGGQFSKINNILLESSRKLKTPQVKQPK